MLVSPRRPARSLASLLVGALIASLALVGFAAPASAAQAPVAVTGGSLTWGVVRDYREALPPTATTRAVSDGASFENDLATFPAQPGTLAADGSGVLTFAGSVRIGYTAGPSGNYISLAQPQITIDGSRAVLSAVSAGRSHGMQPNVDQARRDIAVLDLGSAARTETATTVTWASVGATLTADAVPLVLRLEGSSFFLREAGAALDPVTISLTKVEPEPEPELPTPTVTVSKTDGIDPAGETVTVRGSGFLPKDPETTGTRPPLAGKFTGAYVVFGKFADVWRPSAGAPSSARAGHDTKWAVPAESVATVGGAAAGAIELNADGTFETQLSIQDFAAAASGTYGVYTYPGGGAKYAPFETFTPITFADVAPEPEPEPELPTPTVTVSPDTDVNPGVENVFTVTGTGFTGPGAANGAYVLLGETSVWSGGTALPAAGWVTQSWATAAQIVDGEFTTTLTAPANSLEAGKAYQVVTSAAHGLSATDRSLDTFTPITFADVAPEPEPEPTEPGDPVDPEPVDPPVTPAPTCAPAGTVANATLAWGVKKTFRDYIAGPIASGRVTLDGVAGLDGGYRWSGGTGTFDTATSTGAVTYPGSVAFYGHNGALDLTFSKVGIVTSGAGAQIVADVAGQTQSGEKIALTQVGIGNVDLAAARKTVNGTVVTYTGAPATLASSGVDAFAGFYTEGAALDPVSFSLPVSDGATCTDVPEEITPPAGPATPGGTDNDNGVGTLPASGGTGTPAATTPAAATCVARSVSGASLTWGVKDSFVSYVTGSVANGAISTSGTSQVGNDFRWSGGTGAYNVDASKGRVAFSGGVTFTGHGGILDLTLSAPRLVLNGPGSATLVVDVNGTTMEGEALNLGGVAFATVNLAAAQRSADGSTVSYTGAPATLTAAGAQAFAGFYSAGEALDPVSVTIPLGGDVECTSATGTLAATGVGAEGTALAAVLLVLLGCALRVARRRQTV